MGEEKKSISQKDHKILLELKEKLSQRLVILDMILFGSRARGDADEFSDYDVFIETEIHDRTVRETIRSISWEVGLKNRVVISTLIFSRDELLHSPLRSSPVVQSIMTEGMSV